MDNYLEASLLEIEHSKILALTDEVIFGDLPEFYGDGYDIRVYGKSSEKQVDDSRFKLLLALRHEKDLSKYSIELRNWFELNKHHK